MRVLVLSDTHLRRGGRRRLPDQVYTELDRSDAVLHAGDVMVSDLLHELAGFAPTYAVLGNNDHGDLTGMLPETRVEVLGGVRIGMIHDSGPSKGRPGRMRRRFPDCPLVVYGHSHIPFDGEGVEGQRLFNPGSPTERRAQPHPTYGLLDLGGGEVVAHEIRILDGATTGS
ncbi:MAG TPA: metallophosphoesterase family protein [Acidimicrobiales bacterium]|nr:metallophosphoesterase family protein [Acidimicrobiales bacterium]